MPISFDEGRWDRIREDSRAWWKGELDRPLIQVRLGGADPGRDEPELPSRGFHSHYDMSVAPERIADRVEYNLSSERYLGDGFPAVWPNFGPGVLAAFLGGRLVNNPHTTWFMPEGEPELPEVAFSFDEANPWLVRVRDVMRALAERTEGRVQIGMTDLGGNLDVLSTFRPAEKLLLDLYDDPDGVKRLTWREHEMWWRAFEDLDSVIRPTNPGYTAWMPIFSETPFYMLQCDFCYMIGPDMFDEFVRPELAATCRRLDHAFYHLDGPGQLAHLDSLLTIDGLAVVQWGPGDGNPGCTEWPEVYRKIRDAGKLMQVLGGPRELDAVAEQLGEAKGIIMRVGAPVSKEREMREFLARYGVEAGPEL
ncbi:MAG: hypothetical protein ACYS9X_07675 [Planctomycetota bacterium]|jgi:hypothetical protein